MKYYVIDSISVVNSVQITFFIELRARFDVSSSVRKGFLIERVTSRIFAANLVFYYILFSHLLSGIFFLVSEEVSNTYIYI